MPRGTGRFLVNMGVHIASFRCLSDETLSQSASKGSPSAGDGTGLKASENCSHNVTAFRTADIRRKDTLTAKEVNCTERIS